MKRPKRDQKADLTSLSTTQLARVGGGFQTAAASSEQVSAAPTVYVDKGIGASILKGG